MFCVREIYPRRFIEVRRGMSWLAFCQILKLPHTRLHNATSEEEDKTVLQQSILRQPALGGLNLLIQAVIRRNLLLMGKDRKILCSH
jgi:hypothetical protein